MAYKTRITRKTDDTPIFNLRKPMVTNSKRKTPRNLQRTEKAHSLP